jgi:hypothetical protein
VIGCPEVGEQSGTWSILIKRSAALQGTEWSAGPPSCLMGTPGGVGGASYPDYTKSLATLGVDLLQAELSSFRGFRSSPRTPKMVGWAITFDRSQDFVVAWRHRTRSRR